MLSAAFRFLLPGLSLAFACAPGVGLAAEALALKVLGFSPDGRHFGFIQYGGVGDGGEYTAEAYVIDVERDRVMPRMPLVLASWKEELAEDPRPYGEWLLAFAEKRFAKALAPYRLRPSVPLFADRSARTDETFAISSDVRLAFGSGSVRFDDAKLGRANLDLEEK